jgi:hypothetical protein
MTVLRSGLAVAGGVLLLLFMDATLERTLVSAIGQGPPADEAAYLAIRNRTGVLAITVVTHALASALAGYVIGKIAGAYEVRHALAAATILAAGYASTFFGDNPMVPPAWTRALLLVLTPPALAAGAHIRAEARIIHAEQAGAVRPEERP